MAVVDPRTFSPLPWQLAPWADTSPVMLLAGGAGSGKSVFALHKINALLLRYPGALGLVLRKSRQSLRNSSVAMLESIVGSQVVHAPSKFRFEYPNGSRLVYGGMHDEKQREAIRSIAGSQSSGADFALLEEAASFTEADYEEIVGRMRGKAAPWTQIILCTNPDSETHWINQRFVRPFLCGERHASCYFPRPEDNSTLPPAYIEALRGLTGVRRARLYEGRWVRAEGTVYEGWDPSIHIVDPFVIPRDWRRIRSLDLGFINPRVCLWIGVDGDDDMWVYREIYKTRQRASEFAKEIRRRSSGEMFEATPCDHDAEERAELEEGGIQTIAAIKDVSRGIQAVEDRIAAGRIHFMRDCLVEPDEELRESHKPWSTVQEFDSYVWARNPDGSVTKEAPLKVNDHGMDALRYAVMYLDRDMLDPAGVDDETLRMHLEMARRDLGGGGGSRGGFYGGGSGSRSGGFHSGGGTRGSGWL